MAKVAQLTLSLRSRPGVLAALARTLADARVNISALSAETRAGRGKIHVVVKNLGQAKRALRHAKYRATEEAAFVVRMRNKPGALARVAGAAGEGGRQHQVGLRDHGGSQRYRRVHGRERRQGAQDSGLASNPRRVRWLMCGTPRSEYRSSRRRRGTQYPWVHSTRESPRPVTSLIR